MPTTQSLWRLRAASPEAIDRLVHELGISPLLARLLAARGVTEIEAAHRYLGHAPYELNPWALPGVDRASQRLLQALDSGEPVLVYGDYDADGVTSTTLLFSYLARAGYNAHYFLPHRFEDGYGMNRHALEDLANRDFRLVVTVDNGIASVAEVAFARSLGMDVIVTDHHTPPEVLPEPYALINPRLGGCPPELAGLAGVGVAYTLASALEERAPSSGVEDLLDLVAIGSVADMAPLVGVNRTLVGRGLHRIATEPRPGLLAIAQRSGMESLSAITASDIGYRIGPRINAAGRMDHSEVGLKLFLAETPEDADVYADELERLNRLRQETSKRVEAEARRLAEETVVPDRDAAIVLASDSWHHGVIGIAAARLVESYARPVILLAGEGEVWKGSGRSPETANLFKALEQCRDLLIRWGGHAQAAGVALERDRLDAFRDRLSEAVRAQGLDLAERAPQWVDAEVSLADVTPQAIRELAWLQPTGQGNPEPVLAVRDVAVARQKIRGKERRHLFLELQDGLELREAVGFNMGPLHPVPNRVSVAFTPEFNHFQGTVRMQLRLHGVAIAP
jgi:single-stranded-DNA-specific exonuclease